MSARDLLEGHAIPFSNGEEADEWEHRNCQRCARYRPQPDFSPSAANCPMSEAILDGRVLGTVPIALAQEYGAGAPEDGYIDLPARCARFTTDTPRPAPDPAQQTLFGDAA